MKTNNMDSTSNKIVLVNLLPKPIYVYLGVKSK